MTTEAKQVSSAHKVHAPGFVMSAWTFVRHLLEMCLAMCIGGIPIIILFFVGAAKLGYPDLFQQSPELSVLVIGFILSLPMIVWMRFRGHEWHPILEMASTTIILGILLVSLEWLGILDKSALFEWMRSLACVVMVIPMILRLDLYTGRSGHHH